MKNKLLVFLAFMFSSLAYATTTTLPTVVEPGNEIDFFSQFLDVVFLKIVALNETVGVYVIGFVAICTLAALAAVVLIIAGIILKNKK